VGVEAEFVCANIYDLPGTLTGEFDIVYTSYGVLPWLPDLGRWAGVVAHFLRPGGLFYIVEDHPLACIFQNERPTAQLEVAYPYFPQPQPMRFEPDGSYADRTSDVTHASHEWSHSFGEIIASVLGAGLRLEALHEFPLCAWERFPRMMMQGEDGYWRLKEPLNLIPLIFSLQARR
jgi:SAM-dependent methyltransferase